MVLWFFGLSLVFLLWSVLRPFRVNNGIAFCRVLCPVSLRILGVRLDVRHAATLEQAQPFVLIGNHQSNLDIFFYGGLIPRNTVTIGKRSLARIPIFGWMYYLTGQLLIDRGNPEHAAETLREATERLTRESLSVLIFPEGTRSHGHGLGPFKRGAFHLALQTGYPIQPIAVSSFYGKLRFWRWHAGTITIEVLPPIPSRGKSLEALRDEARLAVANAIERLDREQRERA
jgi:1-acyl-sn-glycerol-3-phosphate acyltransferase